MFALLILLSALLGAVSFRVRGGLTEGWRVQLPGQVARSTWALTSGLTLLAAGAIWWVALASAVGLFAAACLPLWSTIDMGRNEGSFARDFAVGAVHGLCLGAAPTAALFMFSPLWFVPLIGGASWAACYALAWLRTDWSVLTRLRLGKYGNPPEAAELLFGAQFGAALFLAVAGV